jgi:hypothetical protein
LINGRTPRRVYTSAVDDFPVAVATVVARLRDLTAASRGAAASSFMKDRRPFPLLLSWCSVKIGLLF